ncbi:MULTISPECIES: ATP-binding protein [unclassified Frankia]
MRGDDRPFVGRQEELTLLRSRARTAAAGRGGVLLVTGPAGIGKTRLVEESLRADARSSAVPVGRGYSLADRSAPPLWPWQQALRALARRGGRGRVAPGPSICSRGR